MNTQSLREIWDQALQIDRTLVVRPRDIGLLTRHRLRPVPYRRELLFSSMARGVPVLFDDFRVPLQRERDLGRGKAILGALQDGLPSDREIRVYCGRAAKSRRLTVAELLRRWRNGRALVNVTDLHVRGTRLTRYIDCSRLSDFNILADASGDVGRQEILTLVISSAGVFTDSHTDDPDGSNHCFVGKKLWLVWDTFLGLARGLEDWERCRLKKGPAAFDISRFLSVPGSKWFIVEEGQTLFLPGHLTHKVVTLEDYIGIGSFFVILPSYLRTLSRWTEHTPLWALNATPHRRLELVDKITRCVIRKVRNLSRAPRHQRSAWGMEHLRIALREWQQTTAASTKDLLLGRPMSAEFVRAVGEAV